MALSDTLNALMGDIDAAIAKEKVDSDARILALRTRKAILKQAQVVLTPEIEQAFNALKSAGVL